MIIRIKYRWTLSESHPVVLTKCQLLSLIVIFYTFLLSVPVLSNPSHLTNSAVRPNHAEQDLHRLDFRLEGKSCAACLLSIQRKLNSLPGVKQAVVMLKRPYGVSVIYQLGQTKPAEILAIVKDKEPNIKVFEINDGSIGTMPSLLIPPFVPLSENGQ